MSSSETLPLEMSMQIIAKLQENYENTLCIDCKQRKTEFVSVSHGTFLCFLCGESHQRFGKDLSYVKSISEEFCLSDLKMMIAGGNSAFKEFFNFYNLLDAPLDYKYRTKAADFYRELLFLLAKDGEYHGNYPTVEEGLETLEEINVGETANDSTTETIEAPTKWNRFTQIFSKKLLKKNLEPGKFGNFLSSARKSLEGFSVHKAKSGAEKLLKDLEHYFTQKDYLKILTSCSHPENSYETEYHMPNN